MDDRLLQRRRVDEPGHGASLGALSCVSSMTRPMPGTRLEEHEALYDADGQMVISKAARVQNQRLVMGPPRGDRIDRWQSELTDTEVVQFEAVAGEWLEPLGYARRSRV